MNYVNIEHVKAFVKSALASQRDLNNDLMSLTNAAYQSTLCLENWARAHFPTLPVTSMQPNWKVGSLDVLKGECSVGREFLRSELSAVMFTCHSYTPINHKYYFDYSTGKPIGRLEARRISTLQVGMRLLKKLGVISGTTDIAIGYVYQNNPAPCITPCFPDIRVETPAGLAQRLELYELHEYPEICRNVEWFVDKKLEERGITLDAYKACLDEIVGLLVKIYVTRTENLYAGEEIRSHKDSELLRINIKPKPYFAPEGDAPYVVEVIAGGSTIDSHESYISPSAMYAVISQKDELCEILNKRLESIEPGEQP